MYLLLGCWRPKSLTKTPVKARVCSNPTLAGTPSLAAGLWPEINMTLGRGCVNWKPVAASLGLGLCQGLSALRAANKHNVRKAAFGLQRCKSVEVVTSDGNVSQRT